MLLRQTTLTRLTPYLFVFPVIALLVVFRYIPMVSGFQEAFYTLNLTTNRHYVGLENFQIMFDDPTIWKAFATTLVFSLIVNPLQVGLAMLLAELTNQKVPGIGMFRAIYLIPITISINVTAIIWGLSLDKNYGLVNGLLRTVGLQAQPFLDSSSQALWAIIMIVSWIGVPYWSLFFLAGLQGISKEVVESAKIDGANLLETFLYVKLPLLRRTIAFVLVADTVANFTLFAPVYLLTRGGPQQSTNLVMHEAWRRGFVYGDLGIASAMISVLLIIIIVFVAIEFIALRPRH
jgi:multiple sugar transport system permease protein